MLLLITNRPLASAASVNASLGTIRAFAADRGIQISIVALPGSGGQGRAEALAEATPRGRLMRAECDQQSGPQPSIGSLLAPAFGARRFEFATPTDGNHTLSVSAPTVALPATATFQVAAAPCQSMRWKQALAHSSPAPRSKRQPGSRLAHPKMSLSTVSSGAWMAGSNAGDEQGQWLRAAT